MLISCKRGKSAGLSATRISTPQIASGKPDKAISALVKIATGGQAGQNGIDIFGVRGAAAQFIA